MAFRDILFRTGKIIGSIINDNTHKDIKEYLTNEIKRESEKEINKKAEVKGQAGEEKTISMLKKLPGYKKILHNIYIPSEDRTAEVDIIMIHERGLFIIENKNYAGAVYGNEQAQNWKYYINDHGYTIYNPLIQNKKHIRCVQVLLAKYGIITEPYNMIVFNGNHQLKINYSHDENKIITNTAELYYNLKLENRQRIYTSAQVDEIYKVLSLYENPDVTIKNRHIDEIKANVK